ncbi:hypothetical protein PGB90_004391 [Kerria lacca]
MGRNNLTNYSFDERNTDEMYFREKIQNSKLNVYANNKNENYRNYETYETPSVSSSDMNLPDFADLMIDDINSLLTPTTVRTVFSQFPTEDVSYVNWPSVSSENYFNGDLYNSNCSADENQKIQNFNRISVPSVSPIDMEYQLQIKQENKKARNRLAAAKCRLRKMKKIENLQKEVERRKEENEELERIKKKIEAEVTYLHHKLMTHRTTGCQILSSYFDLRD